MDATPWHRSFLTIVPTTSGFFLCAFIWDKKRNCFSAHHLGTAYSTYTRAYVRARDELKGNPDVMFCHHPSITGAIDNDRSA